MIWSLQTLRFIAALMVVCGHAAETSSAITGADGIIPHDLSVIGRAGVDIFFVLSGVVIAKTAPGMTAQQFVWRRFRRIFPIYFVTLIFYLPIFVIRAPGSWVGWRDIVSTILLWPATDTMTAPALGVAWTLCFEMLFYLSAAMVLHDRRLLYILGALYAVAFSMRQIAPVFQFLGNPIVVEFLFGVIIASAPVWRGALLGVPLGFSIIAAAGFLHIAPEGRALELLIGDGNLLRVLVYGLPAALIVYGFMQIRARESTWTHLGDASYSIYLFHQFAISLLLTSLWLVFPVNPNLLVIIGVAMGVLLSWRIHVLVEVPILKAIPSSVPNTRPLEYRR